MRGGAGLAVNDVYSKVYNENYKRVFSFIYKMCRDYHTAEELTQETFFQAFRSFSSFKGKSDVFTWLAAIAKHCYFKYLRKTRGGFENVDYECIADVYFDSDDSDRQNPENLYLRSELKAAAKRLVKKLPSKYRDVVMLRIYADLSFAQVADALSISENSAKVIYFRAKKMLKEEFEHEYSM